MRISSSRLKHTESSYKLERFARKRRSRSKAIVVNDPRLVSEFSYSRVECYILQVIITNWALSGDTLSKFYKHRNNTITRIQQGY
ncbi:hypothetical protein OUZ56_011143 [Daphnia magna]|uniref:Uncharacterized protein n=1 Tax=Daphnia magna TaxID=35525 RepID=A0ABQ9YZE0_9CRUS|nr:hypothetical protein OUZ56_011143 [Daphnia magna]